jgi:Ca2+-binding EF-hand superfamily protein
MGQKQSTLQDNSIDEKLLTELAEETNFSPADIQFLYDKFLELSQLKVKDNTIDFKEFKQGFGIKSSGFAEVLFKAFDIDVTQTIEFFELIKKMSPLSVHAPLAEKARFVFDIFDMDKNGFIEKDEYLQLLKFSLLENGKTSLSQKDFENFVHDHFSKLDANSNGQISFKEFLEATKANPSILNCVTSQLRIQN